MGQNGAEYYEALLCSCELESCLGPDWSLTHLHFLHPEIQLSLQVFTGDPGFVDLEGAEYENPLEFTP